MLRSGIEPAYLGGHRWRLPDNETLSGEHTADRSTQTIVGVLIFPVFAMTLGRIVCNKRTLELKVPPLVVGSAVAAGMFGLSLLTPSVTFAVPGRAGFAFALALLGFVVSLAALIAFRVRKTTVNPLTPGASSAVVSAGVYRVSRNPMYLGFLLALAGWAVYLSNVTAASLLPCFVWYMNEFQIKPEERALLAKFGVQFSRYMATVRRWV